MARPRKLITPKPLPAAVRGTRSSVYTDAIDQFLAAGCDSALVNIERKPATVASALTKAIKADARFAKVRVARRRDEVYLVRK